MKRREAGWPGAGAAQVSPVPPAPAVQARCAFFTFLFPVVIIAVFGALFSPAV